MKPTPERPASIDRYHAIGGVLDIALFEETEGGEEDILDAIALTLDVADFRRAALLSLGYRRIDEAMLFGSRYDPATGALIADMRSAAFEIPEPGAGGELAYAFAFPPYPLDARPAEIQSLFDDLRHAILPAHGEATILDWSSPRLPEVSAYFEPGMEWWGVFLFSIHIPAIRRLTIIAGSTTD